MKLSFSNTILVFLLLTISPCYSQTPEPGGEKVKDPAFVDVPDISGLPRVLLIGDLISLGYTLPVRDLLKGKANVAIWLRDCSGQLPIPARDR